MNNIYLGTLMFFAGSYFSLRLELQEFNAVFLSALIACVIVSFCPKLKRNGKHKVTSKILPNLSTQTLSILVSACFLLTGLWAGSNVPAKPTEELQAYFGEEVFAYGSIEPMSVKRYEYGTSFVLRCEEVRGIDYKQKLRVFTKNKELPLSGRVWCKGKLLELHSLRNPGGFDGERWNYLQGLGGRLSKAEVVLVSEDSSWLDKFAVWNVRLRNLITTNVQGQTGAVLAGMTLGGSSGLDDVTREVFAKNGLVHLLSVSGTHMVLLTGFLLLVLSPLPSKMRKIFILLVILAYALLCGLRPPVVRALCMSAVLLCGGNGAKRGNFLCLLAVVLLIFKPLWLLDIGFQLSFAAVVGLILLYPKLRQMFCSYLPLILGEALAVTMAAQLAVLPFLVAYFHQVSLVSFISNLLLVPILELATIFTLLVCAVNIVNSFCVYVFIKAPLESLSYLGEFLLQIAGWLTQQVLVQAKLLASLPYSMVVIGSLPLLCAVVYYFALALLVDLPCVNFLQNKERKLLLSGAMLCLVSCLLWKSLLPHPLTAYFLDVGQGDCAVIVTPERKVLVIDTGGLKNYDTGSKVVAPFLRSIGKSKVDMLMLSHADYDHAGGTAGLARNIKVEQIVLQSGQELNTLESALLKEVNNAQITRAVQGKRYHFDETVVEILQAPSHNNSGNNENSTVAAIKHGKYKLLFSGDIDSVRERKLQNLEHYDVLKVAHHGSKYSSSWQFLEKVRPSVAVISVGAGNKYGHPHLATLDRLASVGAKVLRTDEMGAVKLVFDDTQIKCYSYVYNKSAF